MISCHGFQKMIESNDEIYETENIIRSGARGGGAKTKTYSTVYKSGRYLIGILPIIQSDPTVEVTLPYFTSP